MKVKNIKFYSTIFGEDGHLDKKISSSLTKQLILMYFNDIKKINKKEIEPQLEQTVLNRLNSWITELVGTDYHLKEEDVIIDNDIPEVFDSSTTNIEIIVTVSLTEKLMNETGLNRKTPWIWSYILIAKETNKEVAVIPFKNITKGTKLEVANIIFPKIKSIVRKDIDKELRKHIEEEHLFLTITGEEVRDYSQEQIVTTIIKVSSIKHSELSNEIYTYDLIIKGQPHDISFNNEIKTLIESKTCNIDFKNITKGTKLEVEQHLAQVFITSVNQVFDFILTTDEFIITSDADDSNDYSIAQKVNVTITTKSSKVTNNLEMPITILGNAHNINIDSIKTLLAEQIINFKNITKGTKLEVEQHLAQVFITSVNQVFDFILTTDEFIITSNTDDSTDYSIAQKVNVTITTKSSKVTNNLEMPITILGNAHNINIDSIKTLLAEQIIDFKNITKGTKLEVEQHLEQVFITSVNQVFDFILTTDEFIITSDADDSNDYSIAQKVNVTITTKSSKVTNNLEMPITILGNAHNIDIFSVKMLLKEQTIDFKNITKGTKLEVEQHLEQAFQEIIKEVLNVEITNKDFTLTSDIDDEIDFTKKQKIKTSIISSGKKIKKHIVMPIIAMGLPHDINSVELIQKLQDKNNQLQHTIKFKNITKGTETEVVDSLINYFENIIETELKFEVTQVNAEDYTIKTSAAQTDDYSELQQIILEIMTDNGPKISGNATLYINVIGVPHNIDIDSIKTLLAEQSIDFKNITKGTKLEVEQHLKQVFITIVNQVFDFILTTDEFIITSDADDSNDYSIAQKVNVTITTKSSKVTNNLEMPITILGNAHSIKELADTLISITKQVIPFQQITHGNKLEIENHLIPIIEKLLTEHFDFTVLINQDFTITISCPESDDYSITKNMDLTINGISSKICDQIIMPITIKGQPHNINEIKEQLILTNPRILLSKKIYFKWELKRLILPEVNTNFQQIINNVFGCDIKEYQDYSLEINSMPIKNYDDNPKKVQVIINGFNNKITGNFTIDVILIRKQIINIELLLPIFTENDLSISITRENTELEIRDKILITIIQNFIKIIKAEHNIDVTYGTDFLINLIIPTIENCYKTNQLITKATINITGKANKIYGQLKYEQVITYNLCLTNFTLSLPPINITLPQKINNQFAFIITKNELENIINPVVQAKVETEIYKILRIKPIFNYDYFLENDIQFSHQYFTINNFLFKIKIKNCEQIFQQRVVVKIEPENLNNLILSPITHQLLYLNNYLNTPKAEIEEYLFSIVRDEFLKVIQNKYNNCAITANSIYLHENKYYELKSNINEIDNYQQPKNIIVTIESLQPNMLIGKIEVPIVVQGITKSLIDSEYLFYIEDKILIGNNNQIITIISNQFKKWMQQQYNILLVTEDFIITTNYLTFPENGKPKIINITIQANEKIQTKISGQFTTTFEVSTTFYDINNLQLNINEEVFCQYQQITKLQLSQILLPIIENKIISFIKNEITIEIEHYKDFWFDINIPEIDDYQIEKTIKIVINTTNNKITGSLVLNLSIKKDNTTSILLITNQ